MFRSYQKIKRRKSKKITVGNIEIGGESPISVQSMTNTLTSDTTKTINQIKELESVGADLVRVSVPDEESSNSLKKIVKESKVPIIADIHFHYKRAIESAEAGAACLRVNPGNIGNINNRRDNLILLGVKFQEFSTGLGDQGRSLNELKDMSLVKPEVIGMPLVYPNPFRQSIVSGAVLSYALSKDFSFELHIYNMQAQRVFKQTFASGGMGARQGKNRLHINKESLGGYLLSSGVYF